MGGIDYTRSDDVEANAARGVYQRGSLGHANHAVLGCMVSGEARITDKFSVAAFPLLLGGSNWQSNVNRRACSVQHAGQ